MVSVWILNHHFTPCQLQPTAFVILKHNRIHHQSAVRIVRALLSANTNVHMRFLFTDCGESVNESSPESGSKRVSILHKQWHVNHHHHDQSNSYSLTLTASLRTEPCCSRTVVGRRQAGRLSANFSFPLCQFAVR